MIKQFTKTSISHSFIETPPNHVVWFSKLPITEAGICDIYDFLVHIKEREEPAWIKEKILSHDKAIVITENPAECVA